MEAEVGKSVTDGEDTKDIYSVVDLEVVNKEALWERDILLFFLIISILVFFIWSNKPIQ